MPGRRGGGGGVLMARIDQRITAVDMDRFKGDVRLKLPLCKGMDNLTEVATLENDGFITEILMLYFRYISDFPVLLNKGESEDLYLLISHESRSTWKEVHLVFIAS